MQQYIQYGRIIATVLKCYFPKVVFGIARIIIWYRTWLGEDLTISFNPTYLIDSLKALNSEKVTISFISSVRPFTLVPADTDEDFMQLITPVRTN